MDHALFLNGVFEDVLEEIVETQEKDKELICVLQPYAGKVIKFLEGNDFDEILSIPFYISTTVDLKHVSYIAEIVGWENKRDLVNNTDKFFLFALPPNANNINLNNNSIDIKENTLKKSQSNKSKKDEKKSHKTE